MMANKQFNSRLDEDVIALVDQLADHLRQSKTQVLEDAIRAYAQRNLPQEAGVMGYQQIKLAQPATCFETGEPIPAGTLVWQELWTDGRPGNIISQAGMDSYE